MNAVFEDELTGFGTYHRDRADAAMQGTVVVVAHDLIRGACLVIYRATNTTDKFSL